MNPRAAVAILSVLALSGCGAATSYSVGGNEVHLDCRGDGVTTVVLLAGMGDDSRSWDPLRETLGADVRTCAWDYPGVGQSTGSSPMTAGVAAAALHGTLAAAGIDGAILLVGHSIAGLTIRVYVGRYPAEVTGVVLFDPTVPSFAHRFHFKEFAPEWDGAVSSHDAEATTSWPDIPFEILRHDSDVYAQTGVWDADVEAAWVAAQHEFVALAARGTVTEIADTGHYVHLDEPQVAIDAILRVLQQTE